jgi:hypothetical protein
LIVLKKFIVEVLLLADKGNMTMKINFLMTTF